MVWTWMRERLRGLRPGGKNSEDATTVLVKVVILSAMRPRRLSRRVILQMSIWSALVLVLLFVTVYTILLAYVTDRRLAVSQAQDPDYTEVYRQMETKWRKVKFQVRNPNVLASIHPGTDNPNAGVWDLSILNSKLSSNVTCPSSLKLLIVVTTAPKHFDRRREIRKTWCNPKAAGYNSSSWHCVFLIGQSLDPAVQQAVENETLTFKDVLLGGYVDSYRNLTYKVLHGISWGGSSCPTPYLLKTDDDCFVNSPLLHDFLLHLDAPKTDLYVGKIYTELERREVIRSSLNKWAVSKSDYPNDYYPPYASGTGYILSRDMVMRVAQESHFVRPIPNEDAYVGIVVDRIGVQPVHSDRFTLFNQGLTVCNYLYVFVTHGMDAQQQQIVFERSRRAPKECRDDGSTLGWS